MNREELIKIFVGKNYNKFMKRNFSIPAFFFGGLYYIYRKLYIIGLLFYLINIFLYIICMKFMNYIVFFISSLLFACSFSLLFCTIYRDFVNKKIDYIMDNCNSSKEAIEYCKKEGGTNILMVVVAITISLILQISITLASKPKTNVPTSDYENNNIETEFIDDNNTTNIENTTNDINENIPSLLTNLNGTYVKDSYIIKLIQTDINKITMSINNSNGDTKSVIFNSDINTNTLTYNNSLFGITEDITVEKTDLGIKITATSSEENNILNKCNGEYEFIEFEKSPLDGIYKNDNTTIILSSVSINELYINIIYTSSDSNLYWNKTIYEHITDSLEFKEKSSFDNTINTLNITTSSDSISVEASSTDKNSILNKISGNFVKEIN